ncbi:MAG TPA: hypothetical protein VJ691_19550 [Vicinamibacterales bacterium]|nr:hypothetical protein [Vicinamibacterales bacterium]
MFAFFAGLAAGLLHVFSGPDHLAAVAPLAADSNRAQWRTGLQWGIGHTIGVLVIAVVLLIVREQLPLERISEHSERIVGVALIMVGSWGVWKASRFGLTSHDHPHAGASFAMGVLHGLAGSSHLFGVLPALAFATRFESILYLAGFGAGAVAGMSAFSTIIGLLRRKIPHRHSSGLLYASSAAALVIGGFWLIR